MLGLMDEPNTERLAMPFIGSAMPAGPPVPCLLSLRGPEKGATFELPRGKSILGRSQDKATVVLAGAGISRAHAEVEVGEGTVRVVDQGSTNGIYVNGKKVPAADLKAGDTLELGDVMLRLDYTDPTLSAVFQEMYRGATRDGLTGLLNRKSVMARIEEEWAAGNRHQYPSVLALLDVDHFKSINDNYGHPAGDAVLVQLAEVLNQTMRTEDVVGRYGGEEFVALLRFAPSESASAALERLRQDVEAHLFHVPTADGVRPIQVTISIGMSPLTPDSEVELAIKLADQALYEAKRGGRNRLCLKEGGAEA